MDSTQPLTIKVVYSASPGRRLRPSAPGGTRRSRSRATLLLGLCSLLVAGGLSYVTWWRVDREIYLIFMMKTPVPGLDPNASASLLGTTSPPRRSQPTPKPIKELPRFVGKTATEVIGITAYAWLTLATLASCALALSAGAMWSRDRGRAIQRAGWLLFAVGVLVLGGLGYGVWAKYGRWYPPNDLRIGMCALVVLALLWGLSLGRAARGLSRLAAILLILSAGGSAAALYLGTQCGAVSPAQSSRAVLATVFVLQSLYGWILLPTASRLIC